MKDSKTNAMRALDTARIPYRTHSYDHSDGLIDGISVARKMGQPVEQVFKTLVTRGASRNFFVFVIPVAQELDLKAAARAVHEKSIEMIHVDEINKDTGYIRGGCSPIGMKKAYRTVFDQTALNQPAIMVSAGKIGQQIELAPKDLIELVHADVSPLTL